MKEVVILVFLAVFAVPVVGLKCIQCNSIQDRSCYKGSIAPRECKHKNQTYCITYSGYIYQGRLTLLFRDCSNVNLSTGCRLLPDDPQNKTTEKLLFCHSTCVTDGCNRDPLRQPQYYSSSGAIPNHQVTTSGAAILVLLVALCTNNFRHCSNITFKNNRLHNTPDRNAVIVNE